MRSGNRIISGMAWMFTGNALTRVVTLAGQVVLGWLLAPEDFGAYAVAVSVVTIVAALRNGGTTQVLIRTGADYGSQAVRFFKYSLAFNTVAMLVLLLPALLYVLAGASTGWVLVAIAISIPLATPAVIFKAKLIIDGRFAELARIGLWAAVIWQGGIVLGAFLGLGAMSFVLPPIMVAIYENLAGRSDLGQLSWSGSKENWQDYGQIFRQTRWLMLSTGMLSLATTGVYFVVALMTDEKTVGIYFFAYQLVIAVNMPINTAIEAVLPASLIQLDSDRGRQVESYLRALRTTLVTAFPAAILFGLALPGVMNLVWQGKWDIAAPVAQMLAACIPAWLVIAICRSLIEARGLWQVRFVVMGLYGVGGMGATAVGAWVGGLEAIALCVTVFYNGFALCLLVALAKKLLMPVRRTAYCALAPSAINMFALACSVTLASQVAGANAPLASGAISMAMFACLGGIGNLLLFRDVWSQLAGIVRHRVLPSAR